MDLLWNRLMKAEGIVIAVEKPAVVCGVWSIRVTQPLRRIGFIGPLDIWMSMVPIWTLYWALGVTTRQPATGLRPR